MSVSLDKNFFFNSIQQHNLRDFHNFAAPHLQYQLNLPDQKLSQMSTSHHNSNSDPSRHHSSTTSPSSSSYSSIGQSLGNAAQIPNNNNNSSSDNQNFAISAEVFDDMNSLYPNIEMEKSAIILDSLDFDISNPNLFLNDDIIFNDNLITTIPSEKVISQSSSSNTELGNFDFDWQNDPFLNPLSIFDETSLNINTPFIENNSNRPYSNIVDEQSSSLSNSIVNKRPKMIQNQKNELDISRRKSVDTIVNSFNRTHMSQTDTITYDTKVLSSPNTSTTSTPTKVENIDIPSTLSSSNAILCVNRYEFFRQMNIRLSTLAQFIRQSFNNRQSDYVDLWERLYPLLKFECQQVQRLIDLTDFRLLNFPKNIGQYSEYFIERDAMNFIPEHVTDYKFPLKVQQDGNEGFRAVSVLLNCNNNNDRGIEYLHEELRVRVVLEMVNRIEKNRRIFEKHTEEISANGGNITTTSVYEGYFHKHTVGLLSNFGLSKNDPQYANYIWQIESLNTCIDGTIMGVPQLCILANILKATIRIIYPDKENRYFNTPIKCKGTSKRIFHFLIYNPLYGLQFPEPPIERYYIAPLVRRNDIFSLAQPTQLQSQHFEKQSSS
ncbi:20194_t:CDS:2 [Rhizophagus irregularis]|nr:20194_t:CDS:2 [Rhizophagus irregularis]